MNWGAIAAIAELLGALGVIASLIYLGGQVRSSAALSRQAAVQSVVNKVNQVFENLSKDSQVADIWVRGSKGLSHLDGETEIVQYSSLLFTMLKPYEELFHYRSIGALDDWAWETVKSNLGPVIGTRGCTEWWGRRKSWFSEEFRAYVESGTGRAEYERWVPSGSND